MNDSAAPVEIVFRIPGPWSGPGDLLQRLPEGVRLTPDKLTLADGTVVEFGAMPADGEFAGIFRSACRRRATDEEQAVVDRYTVNLFLTGQGGSLESARAMMRAAATLVEAGGAGVFIDNSAVAHGGRGWLELTEDGGTDALTFAFVAIIQGSSEVYTMGMHALGGRDILMKRADADVDGFDLIELMRYVADGTQPIGHGDILGGLDGPRFQAFHEDGPKVPDGSPMHNPYGRLKLVSARDAAQRN